MAVCKDCGRRIMFARTDRGWRPLDPEPSTCGDVHVHIVGGTPYASERLDDHLILLELAADEHARFYVDHRDACPGEPAHRQAALLEVT